jgi:hypothetical protein
MDPMIAALPSGATCLGLYFSDVLDLAEKMRPGSDLTDLAGVPKRRYLPFLSYPYATSCVSSRLPPKRSIPK